MNNKKTRKPITNMQMFSFVCGSVIITYLIHLILLIINPAGPELSLYFGRLDDYLADYTNVVNYSSTLDTYKTDIGAAAEHAYPPLTYVFMYLVSRFLPADAVIDKYTWKYETISLTYLVTTVVVSVVFFWFLNQIKEGSTATKFVTALSVILSAHYLYTLERGNALIVAVLATMVFLFYYDSDNRYQKEISLIALAVAFSLKITPAVAGILLVKNKSFKEIFRLCCYAVILFFGPFLFMKGGLTNIVPFIENMKLNTANHIGAFSCNLKTGFWIISNLFSDEYLISDFATISKIITYTLSFFLLLTVFTCKDKMKNVLTVMLLVIMLPATSGTYNILYLIPFYIMFLNKKTYSLFGFLTSIVLIELFCPLNTVSPLFFKILTLNLFFITYAIYMIIIEIVKPLIHHELRFRQIASPLKA